MDPVSVLLFLIDFFLAGKTLDEIYLRNYLNTSALPNEVNRFVDSTRAENVRLVRRPIKFFSGFIVNRTVTIFLVFFGCRRWWQVVRECTDDRLSFARHTWQSNVEIIVGVVSQLRTPSERANSWKATAPRLEKLAELGVGSRRIVLTGWLAAALWLSLTEPRAAAAAAGLCCYARSGHRGAPTLLSVSTAPFGINIATRAAGSLADNRTETMAKKWELTGGMDRVRRQDFRSLDFWIFVWVKYRRDKQLFLIFLHKQVRLCIFFRLFSTRIGRFLLNRERWKSANFLQFF